MSQEPWGVVINVLHLHLHMEHLQRPVHEHLQVDAALRAPPAQLLPVDPRIHKQNAILQIYLQKVPTAFGCHPEQAQHQLRQLQPQVLGDVAHDGAVFGLLRDRLVHLASPSLPGCEEQKREQQAPGSRTSSLGIYHRKFVAIFKRLLHYHIAFGNLTPNLI